MSYSDMQQKFGAMNMGRKEITIFSLGSKKHESNRRILGQTIRDFRDANISCLKHIYAGKGFLGLWGLQEWTKAQQVRNSRGASKIVGLHILLCIPTLTPTISACRYCMREVAIRTKTGLDRYRSHTSLLPSRPYSEAHSAEKKHLEIVRTRQWKRRVKKARKTSYTGAPKVCLQVEKVQHLPFLDMCRL